MKKLSLIILLFLGYTAMAQTNNSWIDYTKTYYKFKIASNGLYRINEGTLTGISPVLGSAPAEQFQLWRNGQEVRLYTSVPTGPLPGNGYIEFYGQMNDGKPDNKLYLNPDYQLSDHWSLETDTASYFLTINPGNNLRFIDTNQGPVGSLTPEPYFMNTQGVYYKNQLNPGYAVSIGFYLYSPSYDMGEGWSSADIYPGTSNQLVIPFSNLNLYTSGPPASFKYAAEGTAPDLRTVQIYFNGNLISDSAMYYFNYLKLQTTVPLSLFPNTSNVTVTAVNTSPTTTDRMVLGMAELTYPSTFNFNGQSNFGFQLPASAVGNYLVINNFNYGGAAPVLLDTITGNRYTGDISTPGQVKFVLPPSSGTTGFILVSEDASNINTATGFVTKNFLNITNSANQGDYLIISNPILYNDGSGNNNVSLYRDYRASIPGGSYNSKIYDIAELTDQFAFGIKIHPAAVKDFISYAKQSFLIAPKFVFLIGKGVNYADYRAHDGSIYADKLDLVPTFGNPGSDILLSSKYTVVPQDWVPQVPIGRLSAVNGTEVGIYLQKMKEYEAAQQSTIQTIDNKAWMKNVLHIIGGKDSLENAEFTTFMNGYKTIIQDTFFGANVTTFSKSSTAAVQLIASQLIAQLFNQGLSFIGYFGHSSANVLEFNLDDPNTYQNQGKYPFFNVSGCTAGNIYVYDSTRVSGPTSLSEQYVLANERGSIAFLASSSLGLPTILDAYNTYLYKNISVNDYGQPSGNIIRDVVQNEVNYTNPDFFTRINFEEINLHGDPALKINSHPLPDYVEEDQLVKINPSFISVADSSFSVFIKTVNIGKAVNDSIYWKVTRTFPDGTSTVILNRKIKAPLYADSMTLNVPIVPLRDKGDNKITVTINATNNVNEITTANNTVVKDFFIFENEARPIFPYCYAIINTSTQHLFASTANPLSPSQQYTMQLDTTALFNSSFLVTKSITSIGGVLEFDPGITYTNNVVYYWRVAVVPTSGQYHWNSSSFIYLAAGGPGYNQSHYYQYLDNTFDSGMTLGSDRIFHFQRQARSLEIKTGLYPYHGYGDIEVLMDGSNRIEHYGCKYSSLQIMVFDSASLEAWQNTLQPGGVGKYGSYRPDCDPSLPYRLFFEYPYANQSYRYAAAAFLRDSIPVGKYVSIANLGDANSNTSFASQWDAADPNGLYQTLKNLGFTQIDSFNSNKPFLYFFQKGIPSYAASQTVGPSDTDLIDKTFLLTSIYNRGKMTSPNFGPALAWHQMHWRGTSLENPSADRDTINIIGIDTLGNRSTLFSVGLSQQDVDISTVNARQYPYIQLQMINVDTANLTPYQLSYWRLNCDPAPEGAIAPNIFIIKDTAALQQGQTMNFGIAFKNISPYNFTDSIVMKAYILDASNNQHPIFIPKQRPLQAGQSDTVRISAATAGLVGSNTLYLEFNPVAGGQPEQYHFNNFIYYYFKITGDLYKPVLDVTFDGVHVLNHDIVSTRPHIVIKLKDESKYLALTDTSLLKVQLLSPDGSLRTIRFDGDTLKWTPANLSSGNNTFTIDYTPYLPGDDVEYQLIVSGRDVSGNPAGNIAYSINIRVIDKPMISNLLNYPNPFTTSTAFVFTLTGSELPTNMRIQIMTITGKIVREITQNELGPIHIGTNITEFKWNGTDTYGQKLANGVYLYRVITNLHGQTMQKFTNTDAGENTDKYFTKGYGKMYLMR